MGRVLVADRGTRHRAAAGTNQYAAEDLFGKVLPLVKMLPDASPRTYCFILTPRDIKSRSLNFRFQFATHSPMQNGSVR